MRIALFPSAYAPAVGGVEELTARLARRLVNTGDEVEVWTIPHPAALPGDERVDSVRARRFWLPLPRASVRAVARAPFELRAASRTLLTAALDFRPDVLHVQCFSANGAYAAWLTRRARVPLVVTLQGRDGDGRRRHLRTIADASDVIPARARPRSRGDRVLAVRPRRRRAAVRATTGARRRDPERRRSRRRSARRSAAPHACASTITRPNCSTHVRVGLVGTSTTWAVRGGRGRPQQAARDASRSRGRGHGHRPRRPSPERAARPAQARSPRRRAPVCPRQTPSRRSRAAALQSGLRSPCPEDEGSPWRLHG